MKRIQAVLLSVFVPATLLVNSSFAQTGGFAVTERGADYNVLQKTVLENGTNRVHHYTEVVTGMNYTNGYGQFVESKEEITILPMGGAAATQGRHQVYFPADIYNGVLEVVAADGRHLRSRPLCVCYADGSNTVFIATLTNSIGLLVSSNQVVYPNAFTDFKADLVCTYRRGGFECDLVFRQQPPAPDQYGLDGTFSTLQLVTEFFNTQDPQQIPAGYDDWYGLQDSTLKFGKLTMAHGKAFVAGSQTAVAGGQTPVYKSWFHSSGRKFLIEEVPVIYLADDLAALPQTASIQKPGLGKQKFASNRRSFPAAHEFISDTNRIQVASIDLNRQPGVVLDYNAVDSSSGSITFADGQTYLITGPVYLGDGSQNGSSVVFQGGSVIKFTADASTGIYFDSLDMSFQGGPGHTIVLTSKDDDTVGEIIPNSTGNPITLTNVTFLPNIGNAISVPNYLDVRYAGIGMSGADPACVWNCRFFNCYQAIQVWGGELGIYNCLFSKCYTAIEYEFPGPVSPGAVVDAQNVTADSGTYFEHDNLLDLGFDYQNYDCRSNFRFDYRNCLFSRCPDPFSEIPYADPLLEAVYVSQFGLYKTNGGAHFYLLPNSSFRNVGTTNIDPDLLAQLQQMTTYAPQNGSYLDTNQPDVGYHYPVNEDSDYDGLPDWWEWKYFGNYSHSGSEQDANGNTLLYDSTNGIDPVPPTITITSPPNGICLVGADHTITITAEVESAPGTSVKEVDYDYQPPGSGDPPIGVSTLSPYFPITWTNPGWTNFLNGEYIISAVAVDSVGGVSDPANAYVTFALDSDGNGLPDYWEIQYFTTNGLDPNSSPDGNGLSLLYDYQHHVNPTNYYDGVLPNLGIINGNGQTGTNYLFQPLPLTILVTNEYGLVLTNAPVVFTVAPGIAQIAATTSDTPVSTLSLRTDSNGLASVWCYFPPEVYDATITNADSTIVAQAWNAGNSAQVIFNESICRLVILSGNNQAGNNGSFLPIPVVIQGIGANSTILTDASVVFTVTHGTALLAISTNDTPVSSLSLRTDSNGLASAWIYFPAPGVNPPDSTILVGISTKTNPVAVTVNEYVPLGHWMFNDTNTWIGEAGQLPLLAANLVGVPSWSSNAMLMDSSSPALLSYRTMETNGDININCQTGSVLFYFKPDWSSADDIQGGTGPGTSGRLIEIGNYDPAFTNGWWSLYFNPDGTQLSFGTSTNGGGMINLSATISWASNTWYQIALTYSPTGSALFVDGQLLTNGNGVIYFPNSDELTNGFRIGSAQDGSNQAAGTFDELETFASPMAGIGAPVDSYWFGIPDYKADPNGTLGAWEMQYFGHLGLDSNGDYDSDGTNNLQDFVNGADPNKINFSFSVANQFVTTNLVSGVITILGGVPSSIAVLVDTDNFTGANWTSYTSPNITVPLGTNQGPHDVWIGLRGLPANAQQTWEETTLVLDSVPLAISITSPADGASFNASRLNVCGNFTAASLKDITVNGIPAFISNTNFEALNVPLDAGSNILTAVIEGLTGETNATSITVIGLTNLDGSMNDPVQFQAAPVAGFIPLPVVFQVQTNMPGTIQQVLYDFNGDGIADFITNTLGSITYTYETNGEYFPVVTIQTTAGLFSSSGGWNSSDPSRLQITAQNPVIELSSFTVTDPVDIKWVAPNLYVLSGSTATITEFNTNNAPLRTKVIGAAVSGFDVDSAGNVYVAVTANNQVWKFIPTDISFQADPNFGFGGFIGTTSGATVT